MALNSSASFNSAWYLMCYKELTKQNQVRGHNLGVDQDYEHSVYIMKKKCNLIKYFSRAWKNTPNMLDKFKAILKHFFNCFIWKRISS